MPQIHNKKGGEGKETKWKSLYNPYELCAVQENKAEFLRAHSLSQNAGKSPNCGRHHGAMQSPKIRIVILALPNTNTSSSLGFSFLIAYPS